MELSEIISKEGRQPDCSGYVTKYDILCSDGKTIRPGAFNDDDGRKVPMVYMHDHKNLENVLGHMYLESRDDGVYGYGYLNASPKGQLAKLYVDAGDISCFSIFANQLKKRANDVMHGTIREVSLVLSGANRGAMIDSPIMHTDLYEAEGGEGVICMGDDYGGPIYGSDDALSVEDYIEHYGRKGMKWGKNIFKQEYEVHPREGSNEVLPNMPGLNVSKEDQDALIENVKSEKTHGLKSREKNVIGEGNPIAKRGEGLNSGNLPKETAASRPSEMPSNKKEEENPAEKITSALQSGLDTLKDLGEQAVNAGKEAGDKAGEILSDAIDKLKSLFKHSDLTDEEAEDIIMHYISGDITMDDILSHADDYGIDNIDYLFPDAKNATNTPTWIKRPDGWVRTVMNGVGRNPFSRIKSVFADITEPDARARGYIKGNKKTEEVFGLLKRTTSPTTVYKKQKLDRDDIVDITDFDIVAWLKTEMRGMLDEELARAFLIGDGRSPASNDKINEGNIRPIWKDDDLFVIRKGIAVTSSTTVDEKCKAFIRAVIKARKDYRGSGNPVLFTTEDMLTDLLLLEDNMGHALYESEEKLATKLRVRSIVTVPVFENISRTKDNVTLDLMGIVVNLNDYKVGADKGGSVNMFDDFDIDYNQEKYLIETRCSGALVVPYSAIVIESSSSVILDVEPDDPTTSRYSKLVSDLQSDVVVNDDSIFGTLHYTTGYTGFSEDEALQSGYYLALKFNTTYGATTTVQLLNNGGSGNVVTMDDDYLVCYIRSKNAKLVIETTAAGVAISKTYSLRGLKLEK